MKRSVLYPLWGGMFILCAGLGFIPEPAGVLASALQVLAVMCFVPPLILLYRAQRQRDRVTLKLIGSLSALSLCLSLLLILLNILSAAWPEWLGLVLHGVLVIVSSPMICSGSWALSLFLWACLLMTALRGLLRCKK